MSVNGKSPLAELSLRQQMELLSPEKQLEFKKELVAEMMASPTWQAHKKRDKRKKLFELEDDPFAAATPDVDPKDLEDVDFLLGYLWQYNARPSQMFPWHRDDFMIYHMCSGRGAGKTRAGAESVIEHVTKLGKDAVVCVVAPTASDARDVCVLGISGLLARSPSWNKAVYSPANRLVYFPESGGRVLIHSAQEADRLRGGNWTHCWFEEQSSWPEDKANDVFDMAIMGLRAGENPRAIVTSTPKPTALTKRLLNDPLTITAYGSTFDNAANLPKNFIAGLHQRYGSTSRLARQELYGEVRFDAPDALWTQAILDATRSEVFGMNYIRAMFSRIVVSVDPAVTVGTRSDLTGIVVGGIHRQDGRFYALEDVSGKYTPAEWAKKVIMLYEHYAADLVACETNNGGLLVVENLKSFSEIDYATGRLISGRNINVKQLNATRGKWVRAEPVAAMWQTGRASICGAMPELEEQLCSFSPKAGIKSPDRLDALVWAVTELMITGNSGHEFF